MPAIKIAVIVLFVLLIISLFSSLTFIIKDQDTTESKRGWWTLSIRLVLGLMLVSTLVYGVMTGQLGSKARWDAHKPGARSPASADAQPAESETPKAPVQ